MTFLFTDVEGSTRLLHELGAEAYAETLQQHRRVLRECFGRHGGVEMDTQGDAFFVAFPRAPLALAAALEAQDVLGSGLVSVRMGLHTGTPHRTDEGYVGEDVHLGARIAAVGHGGQVLLSSATRELVEAETADLGEHRLKDFEQAVPIFQLGSARFPPLKTISNTNLPRPASSFVGREQEAAEVVSLVRGGARLVTLSGPGGSGKTRLAIEAAAELVGEFRAGVFWVGLATVRDPRLVLPAVERALGAQDSLASYVGEKEVLLLLDNLEQVIDVAPELAALVEACPNLALLVTSRELLRVRGEQEFEVLPLAEPEGVALFCERSGLRADSAVEELCRRLDEMPLALELAASRTKALSPMQILDRLGDRLDLLKGGRDAEPRQATLRATIEWSYELLSPAEQRLFARLAVFAGGCTLEASQQVADADLDTLQSLVEKSLVRHTNERFWMLETIREFATDRLDASGDGEEMRRRHATFFLGVAESTCLAVERIEQGEMRYDIAFAEQDNFRASIDWALVSAPEFGLRIAVELEQFWISKDPVEGMQRLEALLDRPGRIPIDLRAAALRVLGGTTQVSGDKPRGRELYEQSLELYERIGDEWWIIHLRHRVATSAVNLGDWRLARSLLEENSVRARAQGSAFLEAEAVGVLAIVEDHDGNVDQAIELTRRNLELSRQIGFTWFEASALLNLAEFALKLGRIDEAEGNARSAIALCRALNDRRFMGYGLALLSVAARARADVAYAGRLWGALEAEGARTPFGWTSADISALEQQVLADPTAELEDALNAGRRLTFDEAIDYALSVDSPS